MISKDKKSKYFLFNDSMRVKLVFEIRQRTFFQTLSLTSFFNVIVDDLWTGHFWQKNNSFLSKMGLFQLVLVFSNICTILEQINVKSGLTVWPDAWIAF